MKKRLFFTMLRCVEKALLVNLFLFWACSIGYSAIGFDATTQIGAAQQNAGSSWSHTVGTGLNRIILVGVAGDDYNPPRSVTAVTYGGQALTRAKRTTDSAGSTWSEIWYLVQPPSGTNTVSVTLDGTPWAWYAGAISYTGVNQTVPMDATPVGTSGLSGTPSATITTVTDGAVVVDGFCYYYYNTLTPNNTQNWNNVDSWYYDVFGSQRTGPISPAGAVTLTWSGAEQAAHWSQTVVALRPLTTSSYTITASAGANGKFPQPVRSP